MNIDSDPRSARGECWQCCGGFVLSACLAIALGACQASSSGGPSGETPAVAPTESSRETTTEQAAAIPLIVPQTMPEQAAAISPIVPQTTTVAALPAPDAMTLDLQGLAGRLAVTPVEAAAFDPERPAGGNGTPAALRLTFDDQPITDRYVVPRERQLWVYPAGAFYELYKGTNMLALAGRVESLADLLNSEPVTISMEIPLLPELGASQALAVQKRYLGFGGGRGIRFVAHYGQGLDPFTNQSVFYTFQGLTEDGRFYVSFFYPVRTDVLADQFSDVSKAEEEEIVNSYAVYRARMDEALNGLTAGDFVPDLAKLDAMVASLRIGR